MFGPSKGLAALVAYLPLLMVPALVARWVSQSTLVTVLSSLVLVLLWIVLVAGTVWFVRLLRRHPKMSPYAKKYRIAFLVLGALPLGAFFVFYLVTAPFVFRVLAQDPSAPPKKKILNLNGASL